jgi:putative redox protein
MLTTKATWTGGLRFECRSGSGHTTIMDAPPEAGGEGSGPSPVEVTLASLAACSGVDVADILTKMKCPPASLEVRAEAERCETHPRVFTRVRLRYLVTGDVPEKKLARAIALSSRTYCSVGAMLGSVAVIEHAYELNPD